MGQKEERGREGKHSSRSSDGSWLSRVTRVLPRFGGRSAVLVKHHRSVAVTAWQLLTWSNPTEIRISKLPPKEPHLSLNWKATYQVLTLSRLWVEPVGGEGMCTVSKKAWVWAGFLWAVAWFVCGWESAWWFTSVIFIKHDIVSTLCMCIFKFSLFLNHRNFLYGQG